MKNHNYRICNINVLFCFQHQMMLHSACYLMSYIADVLSALKLSADQLTNNMAPAAAAECRLTTTNSIGTTDGSATASGIGAMIIDVDNDWTEDVNMDEEEDDAADDSVS